MVKNRILILGNLGYVGPELTKILRNRYPNYRLDGYDIGYFAMHYTTPLFSPDNLLDKQYYGDIRKFDYSLLNQYDVVVALAAISNDPIGNQFEEVTQQINYHSIVNIAKEAKKNGAQSFVFASSCSVYGFAEEGDRTEQSDLNPLTAYAKSKVETEKQIELLADQDFTVTSLRFATACGMSDRLRLDLVLNDFVACALTSGKIDILSDGQPWRPLIHVKDMGRAIDWAIHREGKAYVVVNVGSNKWNYQVVDLAHSVQSVIPNTSISINEHAAPDKRSYRVDFSLFESLAPQHQPQYSLIQTIEELVNGLVAINFNDINFRNSRLIRLNVIKELLKESKLNRDLAIQF